MAIVRFNQHLLRFRVQQCLSWKAVSGRPLAATHHLRSFGGKGFRGTSCRIVKCLERSEPSRGTGQQPNLWRLSLEQPEGDLPGVSLQVPLLAPTGSIHEKTLTLAGRACNCSGCVRDCGVSSRLSMRSSHGRREPLLESTAYSSRYATLSDGALRNGVRMRGSRPHP